MKTPNSPAVPKIESEDALLSTYLAGKLERSQADGVEEWLTRNPIGKTAIDGFLNCAVEMDIAPPKADRVIEALNKRMALESSSEMMDLRSTEAGRKPMPVSTTVRGSNPRRWMMGGAAAFASFVLFFSLGIFQTESIDSNPNRGATTYSTPRGQRSNVTLPDGSKVVLNVDSYLEVPAEFGTSTRTIKMRGEAFFDVVSNAEMPFVVVTDNSETRVLGTSFVVREYPSDSIATISVKSGEVAVQNVVLGKDQQVKVSRVGMVRVLPVVGTPESFTNGVLDLRAVPVSEAIVDLGRWYDAEIRTGNSDILKQEITGKFAYGSLYDLVAILEMALDVRVERNGRVLTIYPDKR